MMLTKDQILEAADLKFETVEVPEWGGSVRVRTLTGADRDVFESSLMRVAPDGTRTPDMTHMRAKLVVLTAVGESGALLFSPDDVAVLARKSASALERVFDAAQRLNGIGALAEADVAKN